MILMTAETLHLTNNGNLVALIEQVYCGVTDCISVQRVLVLDITNNLRHYFRSGLQCSEIFRKIFREIYFRKIYITT